MNDENTALIRKLAAEGSLPDAELRQLLTGHSAEDAALLFSLAREVRERVYGKDIYLRGLIEFSNYCRNDCLYCGIRRSNARAERYRLSREEILDCCAQGYALGFRTFVLQSGEDLRYRTEDICDIVYNIRSRYPDCAVTLSIGEKTREEYAAYFAAGAERYLLRHETADETHYRALHPQELSLENRKRCLYDLREIGYQVGCGMMVGAPGQTPDCLLSDFRFMQALQPEMIGIGPFISHHDTPLRDAQNGSVEETLWLLGLLRLCFPRALLPATTALGTLDPQGREKGILAGANVVMPNLSPRGVRKKYLLYDGKICTGDEAAECRRCMERRMERIGYRVVEARGDYKW